MLPKWHVLLGIIFTAIIWIFSPQISAIYLILIFASSVLMDFDHYAISVLKTGKISLFNSFDYHKKQGEIEDKEIKKGLKKKGDFHIFHTVEFHLLVGMLILLWAGFFYIFIGMIFHSMLDLISLIHAGKVHRREYSLISWMIRRY